MPFNIKVSKQFKTLLDSNSNKGLVASVKREFSQRSLLRIKREVLKDMNRGISPVKGAGRWKKYSNSYKDVIQNKAAYRTVNGRVIRISADSIAGTTRLAKSTIRTKIRDLNRSYHSKSSPTKQISPVNIRHSGKLHRDFKIRARGGFLRNFRIVFIIRNKLADIHNRLGAGKSKVVRRLLPTRSGENFNNRIDNFIFSELKKAVDFVAKQFSRQ